MTKPLCVSTMHFACSDCFETASDATLYLPNHRCRPPTMYVISAQVARHVSCLADANNATHNNAGFLSVLA